MIVAFAVVLLTACNSGDYKKATSMYNDGQYKEAVAIFEKLGDYEDSEDMLLACKYAEAEELFNKGKYEDAIAIFDTIKDYKNSSEKISLAEKEIMLRKYGDVIKKLENETWYFNGGSDTTLNRISFNGLDSTIEQVYFDGNGKWDNGSNTFSYSINDKVISIVQADGSMLDVDYKVDGDTVSLGNGDFLTLPEIDSGIQGYWYDIYSSSYGKSEYHILFDKGTVRMEYASQSLFDAGDYFYYGPYEGTYTLNFGGFDTDMRHGSDWFYNVIDGKAAVLRYGDVATQGGSFLGENGYSF